MTALLTLPEAKTALAITGTTYDAELQDYIDGTIEAVEFICGPVNSTAQTDVIFGCGALVLRKTPVLTVTSVTGDLMGIRDMSLMRFDADSGVVRPIARAIPLLEDWYTVVYTYGRASIPTGMKNAAKVILKDIWDNQRRGPKARGIEGRDAPPGSANRTIVPGLAYAIHNSALQMLSPYERGPAMG